MTEIIPQPAQRTDGVVRWMIAAISVAATSLPLTWGVVFALDSAFDFESSVFSAVALFAIWVSIASTIAAGGLVAVAIVRPPRGRIDVRMAATLGVLAGATPMSVVLFFRFQYSGCVGFNFFGVPWSEPWQTLAQVVTAGIVLGVAALTVSSFVIPNLRRVAVAVLGWLLVSAIPTFLVFFLSIYGDPGPGCMIR